MSTKSFMALVEKKKSLYGISDEVLAEVIGVSERTFKRRKRNPGQFTIDEMNYLIKFLKFTEDERKEALL